MSPAGLVNALAAPLIMPEAEALHKRPERTGQSRRGKSIMNGRTREKPARRGGPSTSRSTKSRADPARRALGPSGPRIDNLLSIRLSGDV